MTQGNQSSWPGRLAGAFERNADRQLFLDVRDGSTLSYGQFWHDSRVLASCLAREGVKAGDSVVFSMENCTELARLYFACMHLGARVVPVNPSYHPRDYAAILERVSARHFVTAPSVLARLEETLRGRQGVRVLCCRPAVETLKAAQAALVNFDFAAALAAHQPHARTLAEADDREHFLTVLTSGTSNVPKGIRIGYAGLLGNGARMAEHLGLDRESRFYNVLSLSYLGGVFNLTLVPVLAGGSVVLDGPLGATNVYGFWETVREHGVNTLWFSPTMLAMLLALDDEEDLSFLRTQVRVAMCGMAPLPGDLKKRFEERFGFALQENYALSETGFVTVTRPGAPGKPGAVGGPLPGVEVRILDGDLRPLATGREGQIAVRSDHLMLGYDVPEGGEGKAPMHGEFFLTGDVGYRDEDGDLYVTGRLKDIIIRGGVNISPKMIEDTVYRLEPVQEAAVVGVPHPMYGEEVALVVKLREASRERVTVDDVRRFCELHIAHFQRPKYIFSIDELPKGVTGKIQKNVLKRLLADRLDPLNG